MSGDSHSYNTRHKSTNRSFVKSILDDDQATTSTSSNFTSQHTLSVAESISELPYFEDDPGSVRRGEKVDYYSLVDIVAGVGLDYSTLKAKLEKEGHGQFNDHIIARECIEVICNEINPNLIVKANVEIHNLQLLPTMTSTSRQRPDIVVYMDSTETVVGFRAEVCSSPMLYTERKAILGAADLLRLQRCTDPSKLQVTTFALPNTEQPQLPH